VPGRPEISPFFQLLSFNGPMYHVFEADEEQLLRDWCVSLAESKPKAPMSLLDAMNYVIDTLRERQVRVSGHEVRISGPDPKRGGETITQSLHLWFDAGNRALLAALADPANGWVVPFDSIASPLTSALLGGNGAMAQAFRSIVPDTDGLTCGNVMAKWIDAGCPLEEPLMATISMLRSTRAVAPIHHLYRRPNGKIWGMGTPH
jgi:hypothetical protein